MGKSKVPTLEEVQALVDEYVKKPRPPGNGWQEFDECPICGHSTGFSMVVDPEGTKKQVPLGYWSCLAASHGEPNKGTFGLLMKTMGREWQGGDGSPAPTRETKRERKVTHVNQPAPQHDKISPEVISAGTKALLENEEVMAWLKQRFGLEPEHVEALHLGYGSKKMTIGKKGKEVTCDKWLMIPFYDQYGRDVEMVKSRTLPPYDKPKKQYCLFPGGVAELYNLHALQRFMSVKVAENPEDDQILVILEGESDVWTWLRLFGMDSYVIGVPGARAIPDFLPDLLERIQHSADGSPRILIIPDADGNGNEMALELARRTGSGHFSCCELPPPGETGMKDVTDLAVRGGWTADQFMEHISRHSYRMSPPGAEPIGRIYVRMSTSESNLARCFKWHVAGCDRATADPKQEHDYLPAGRIAVMIGPRKHRKTSLCLWGAWNTSIRDEIPGCINSFEMPNEDVAEILYPMVAGRHFTRNFREEQAAFGRAIMNSQLYVGNGGVRSIADWKEYVKDGVKSLGWRYVIVDSLTHLCGCGDEAGGTAGAWVSTGKTLASELGLFIIFLSHVTPEKNTDDYSTPIRMQQIRYYKDVLNMVDYGFCVQSKERPDPTGRPAIGRSALFQAGLTRFRPNGPTSVELMWDDYQRPRQLDGAFTRDLDLTDDFVDSGETVWTPV